MLNMTQENAEQELQKLRSAQSRLIRAERARQGLSQVTTTALINDQLRQMGHRSVTRGHLSNIELGTRGISEPVLRALSRALGIQEAQLRHPLADLWAAA